MMADSRVHPASIDTSSSTATSPKHSGEFPTPPDLHPSKPVPPPPATYVVQFPREQIFRYPPPANAAKFQSLRTKNRSRRCCCYTLLILVLILIAAAISAGVIYLVFRFKSPKYTVTRLATNLNSTSTPISPHFNVTIRAQNPNDKVGIYYLKNSDVSVFYNDAKLSDGVLPAFYQPKKNVTMLHTPLTGSHVILGSGVRTALRNAQRRRNIPFLLRVKAPIKIKVGSVNTWEITVRVKCHIILDVLMLNHSARILSNRCDSNVRLW